MRDCFDEVSLEPTTLRIAGDSWEFASTSLHVSVTAATGTAGSTSER